MPSDVSGWEAARNETSEPGMPSDVSGWEAARNETSEPGMPSDVSGWEAARNETSEPGMPSDVSPEGGRSRQRSGERSERRGGIAAFRVIGGELARLLATRERFERQGPVGELRVVETEVPADAEVRCCAVLEAAGSQVTVRGQVTAPWSAPCRRCAEPLTGELDAEVLEVYERHPSEGETWPLGEEEIDLAPMLREIVMLDLPFAPEGPVDDTGTCLTCGRDVTPLPDDDDEGAGAGEPAPDPRWAALDGWTPPADDDTPT